MITTDMLALREAAMAGVGLVQLPVLMVKEQLLLPVNWSRCWKSGSPGGRLFMLCSHPGEDYYLPYARWSIF